MDHASQIIPRLLRLDRLERAQPAPHPARAAKAEIASLRAVLPTAILRHHDARRERGKASVAPLRRGICGACHISLPRGRVADVRRASETLSVCDHCGAFIFFEEEEIVIAAAPEVPRPATAKAAGRTKTTPAAPAPKKLKLKFPRSRATQD